VAGHSLGEYSAIVAAGGLSLTDAVTTVQLRGQLMQEAVPEGEGAMAALVGLEAEQIETMCKEEAGDEVLSPANYNAPGQIVVSGHQSKFYRERTVDCIGLDTGEESPFDDLFADMDTDPAFEQYTFALTIPTAVNTSMRNYDSVFSAFFRILPSTSRLSTRVNITDIPGQTTTATGKRTWIDISNPFQGSIDVFPTVTTPGGTVYVLDPVSVGARMRVRFSPDGNIFREIPNDPLSPPVPFLSLELSGAGGLFYNARKTTRNAQDLILFMRPTIVRNETFE
jgi:hypothetical protein